MSLRSLNKKTEIFNRESKPIRLNNLNYWKLSCNDTMSENVPLLKKKKSKYNITKWKSTNWKGKSNTFNSRLMTCNEGSRWQKSKQVSQSFLSSKFRD